MSQTDPLVVAAVQTAPVFLDRAATLEKACTLVTEAADHGARLVVFPECFVPTYPLWVWSVPAGDSSTLRELYAELVDQSVEIPGPVTDHLGKAARDAGVTIAIGVNERNAEASGTTLYNTLLIMGADGAILGRHRKLIPTAGERLIHGQGDGSGLEVHRLPWGLLGGLICWENYMPLARYTVYSQGVQIYLAPTWDRGEPWLSTLRHIAKEGRAYVIGSCCAVRRSDILDRWSFEQKYLTGGDDWLNPGDSAIVDPDGKLVAGPLHGEEGILYATVDTRKITGPRFQLDVAGHYARPDVFELRVRRVHRPMIHWLDGDPEQSSES